MLNDIFSKSPNPNTPSNSPTTKQSNTIEQKRKTSPKNTNQKLPEILIDYREKNSLVPAELKALGHKIILKELKVADYIINEIAIERKTFSDLTQSMINRRLKKQLEELKQYKKHFLLIETKTIIFPSQIKGFILSILLNHKTPIIFTNSPKETANYISILSKQKPHKTKINPSKKQNTFYEQQLYILQSFPNIGPKKSEELLKKFKSLKKIFNSTPKELNPILGKQTQNFLKQLI